MESAAAAAAEIRLKEKQREDKEGRRSWPVDSWLTLSTPSLLLRRQGERRRDQPQQQQQQQQRQPLQPWEFLFVSNAAAAVAANGNRVKKTLSSSSLRQEERSLTCGEFCKEIQKMNFLWPSTRNTGQAPWNARAAPGKQPLGVQTGACCCIFSLSFALAFSIPLSQLQLHIFTLTTKYYMYREEGETISAKSISVVSLRCACRCCAAFAGVYMQLLENYIWCCVAVLFLISCRRTPLQHLQTHARSHTKTNKRNTKVLLERNK